MEYLLKASAVLALFYLCYILFLKKETFFEYNRWFLLTGLIIALVFPFVIIPIYITYEPVSIQESANFVTESLISDSSTAKQFEWQNLIPFIYIIGFSFFLIRFILQFGSLIVLLLKNQKNTEGFYTYIIIKNDIAPFSFFKWIVYNPEQFNSKELNLIISHEKVHAREFHSIDILFTQFTSVIFWFNPFAWFYKKDLQQNLEYIADYKAQNTSSSEKDYQRLLLKTSIANQNLTLANNFYNSLIKKRIVMLHKSRSKTIKQWKYLLILPLLTAFLMSVNTKEILVEDTHKAVNKIDITSQNQKELNTFKQKSQSSIAKSSIQKNNNLVKPYKELVQATKKETIEIIFTKNTTDKELDNIKSKLLKEGITFNISQLERNSKNEITAISVDFKAKDGSANYNINSTEPIKSFYFKLKDDGGFGVGTIQPHVNRFSYDANVKKHIKSNAKHKIHADTIHALHIKENGEKNHKIVVRGSVNNLQLNNGKTPLFVVDGEVKSENEVKTLNLNHVESVSVVKGEAAKATYGKEAKDGVVVITSKSDNHFIHKNANNKEVNEIILRSNDGKTPLFILDKKEVSENKFKTLKPDNIKSVNILKGVAATETYGSKGKNGVVVIKSKGKGSNKYILKSDTVTFDHHSDTYSINKNTTNETLNSYRLQLKQQDIDIKFSKMKRNNQGELTSIKIAIDDNKGSKASSTWNNNNTIPTIMFGKREGSVFTKTKN